MSTTALFVEILVAGLQALAVLAMLATVHWGTDPALAFVKAYKEYAALITALVLASAYVLGIFVDRVADGFCTWFRYSKHPPLPESVGKVRLRIMQGSEGMAKFLDYQRSRLRIARATVFNLFVLIVASSIFMLRDWSASPAIKGLAIAGAVALFGISVVLMRSIDKAQMKRLIDAYHIITEKKQG